jgi:hypothetical protein
MDEMVASLLCPISQSLLYDPVIAPDGHTYSRGELEAWAKSKHIETRKPIHLTRCPLNDSVTVGDLKKLLPNRLATQMVEYAVRAFPEHELAKDWQENKRVRDALKAESFWSDGRVAEAAELGHAEATEEMRKRKMVADSAEIVQQAKTIFAANRDDPMYRKLLRQAVSLESQEALRMLAAAYDHGLGGDPRPVRALQCYRRLLGPSV